jgi:hypothetical protein
MIDQVKKHINKIVQPPGKEGETLTQESAKPARKLIICIWWLYGKGDMLPFFSFSKVVSRRSNISIDDPDLPTMKPHRFLNRSIKLDSVY